MKQRPRSVTFIGWLFIGAGTVGLAYHATEFKVQGPFQYEVVWVCLVRLLAIVGGVSIIRGCNWGRSLLFAWMAYHIVLSVFHSLSQLAMHTVLFGVIAFFLLRPRASVYFRAAREVPAPAPKFSDPPVDPLR